MTKTEIIKNFFLAPNNFRETETSYSKLHLLRRDVLLCYGINPNNGEKVDYKVLFPGTITLFTGIDLLAKLYFADDSKISSRNRFLGFLNNTKLITLEEANILYQLRNALVHSFGLTSIDKSTGNTYQFILTENDSLIEKSSDNEYKISYLELNEFFEKCIFFLHNKTLNDNIFKTNFIHKLKAIGFLKIFR